MTKYAVTFTGSITVYVEADSRDEAIDIADQLIDWEKFPSVIEEDAEEV